MSAVIGLGEKLRAGRMALGIPTREMAVRLGVSQPTISARELDTRGMGLDEFIAHAQALGMDEGDLLRGPEQPGLLAEEWRPHAVRVAEWLMKAPAIETKAGLRVVAQYGLENIRLALACGSSR